MRRIRWAIILIIGVVIIATGIWWLVHSTSSPTSPDIFTSGFIEVKDVTVAFEVGGRIVEITAEEGDQIKAGVTLVKLDDSLLKAQKRQAEANVQLAQAYLEQAIVSQEGAKKALENARIESAYNIAIAQAQVSNARERVDNFKKAEDPRGIGMIGTFFDHKANTLAAEGELAQAELNLEFQTKNVTVDQANTAYEVATAAVKAARIQVEQATAALKTIETQLSQLTSFSPVSGVVAAKHAEVGEIAKPGAPILTITELDKVTLTAYVPESKIGRVKLGQKGVVSVDSYPDDRFSGKVVYISPQAQFTPKNVQLKEEREKTVFAVKIRLDNPDQKLKPGMPADARIITNSGG